MNAACATCQITVAVSLRRGEKIAGRRCPRCRGPLTGSTAGKATGRYLCAIQGSVVTLGLTGWQLERAMVLQFKAGRDRLDFGRRRTEPDPTFEKPELERAAGKVFGPGAVVSTRYRPWRDEPNALAGLYLVDAAQTGEQDEWVVNEPVAYAACACCRRPTIDLPERRPAADWQPVRTTIRRGRGRVATTVDLHPGPYPAGTLACSTCLPPSPVQSMR